MQTTLIKAARLVNGTGGAAVEPAALLMAGGVIEAVGEEAAARAAEASEIWDLGEQTLLPGLIDCHNHLSLDPTLEDYLHRMNDPLPELTLRAVHSMKVDLMAGVTTSRCLGDRDFLDIACRKAQAAGTLLGPRLLVATRGIRAPHGHGFVGYPFGGVEPIRSAVRENLLAGADLIKVYITGTLRGPRQVLHYYSREEIQVAVDEAHRTGVPVATHCIGGQGLKLALETGIDVIEHGYFVTDEEIESLLKYDRWLVMTPSIFFTDARIRTLPPNLVDGHLRQREEVRMRLAAAIRAGVKYGIGTDAMHGGMAREIGYVVEMGATPAAALRAATADAARICGLEDRAGTIEKGKWADCIGVTGNPLENPDALERVRTVIQKGRLVRSERAA
jgi:imidazolonepropionase-like amidohydrolase